jgi:hypothetical protein
MTTGRINQVAVRQRNREPTAGSRRTRIQISTQSTSGLRVPRHPTTFPSGNINLARAERNTRTDTGVKQESIQDRCIRPKFRPTAPLSSSRGLCNSRKTHLPISNCSTPTPLSSSTYRSLPVRADCQAENKTCI